MSDKQEKGCSGCALILLAALAMYGISILFGYVTALYSGDQKPRPAAERKIEKPKHHGERSLDEIAGLPLEERSIEEQQRLEKWAEADAYFRLNR